MSGEDTAGFGSAALAQFAERLSLLTVESGKAWARYLGGGAAPYGELPATLRAAADAFSKLAETLAAEPGRSAGLQAEFAARYADLWAQLRARLEGADPGTATPFPDDRRFSDPEWGANPHFDFLRRAHLLAKDWTAALLETAALDEATRLRAGFYTRELLNAASPANFVLTNPVVLRATLESGGETLRLGMQRLVADMENAGGELHVRHSEPDAFRLGETLAATPGAVVFRNRLIELIQYAPATPRVRRRPVLIVPPWINKFYILDLAPGKSFVEWAVSQGLAVFCISWVNPDASLREASFADYFREGVLAALDVVESLTGRRRADALGYCIGGTLLAAGAAVMRAKGDGRFASLTLLAAQLDFSDPGDLKLFIDEEQLAAVERAMAESGTMDGRVLARVFNHLRSDELVWPYLVDAYLLGKPPARFDILHWNGDTTRIPAANHSFYLRRCYGDNALAAGRMRLDGDAVDLARLDVPVYGVAASEDGIAPAGSVFTGLALLPGPVRLALSTSGHIAGIVNPPARGRYRYAAGALTGGESFADWRSQAEDKPGSWWPDWLAWLRGLDAATAKARKPGSRAHPPLGDAPGTYVHVR